MPKVSVIMSAFNEERNIADAMDSILNQSYEDYELIIINDGSTDNTLKIIKDFALLDKRIKLVDKGYNSGLADSLNIGIENADGEFIARLDADDYSERERLEIQVEFMKNNPEVGLVGSWGYILDQNNSRVELRLPTEDNEIKKFMQKDNPFIHSSVLIRRFVLDQIGNYSPIKEMEDYDLWLRIAKNYQVANVNEFLVTRRENNNFHTRAYWKGKKKYNIYSLRLRYQLKAVKYFGIYPETPWYLCKTLLSMMLSKIRLRM